MANDDATHESEAHAVRMRVDVAVLKEKVGSIERKIDALAANLSNVYATRADMKVITDDVEGLKANQGWIIKLIVGAVLVAVLGLVIVKGGVGR